MVDLIYWMAKTSMTTAKLVEESGLNKNTITDLKKHRRTPNPITISKLAKAFGVDVKELLEPQAVTTMELSKEQLLKALRTGRTDADNQEPTRVLTHRIEDMDEKELREAVIEFIYS